MKKVLYIGGAVVVLFALLATTFVAGLALGKFDNKLISYPVKGLYRWS